MKQNKYFIRKAYLDKLLRTWEKMPNLTFGEMIWKSSGAKHPQLMTDDEILKACVSHVKVYKEEHSLKNKIKKGFKTCVTKMTLW